MFYPQPQVAAVRMTQWAKRLGEFGWSVSVVCQDFGHRAGAEQITTHLGSHVSVEYFNSHQGTPTSNPDIRLKQWMQRQFGIQQWWIPDRSIRVWQKYQNKILETYDRLKPDVVLTSSPPHSIHEIGLMLKRQRDAKWIADFRDPWLIDKRFQPRGIGGLFFGGHRKYEKEVYESADRVICAIPIHGRWIKSKYKKARDHVEIIANGIPEELLDGDIEGIRSETDRHSIRIIGSPGGDVLDVVAAAIKKLNDQGQNLELCLVGPKPTNQSELEAVLGPNLKMTGPLEHQKALGYILGADLLICPLEKRRSASLGMSSKLFEYVASGVPSVVINPTKSDRLFFGRRPEVRMVSNVDVNSLATIFKELVGQKTQLSKDFVEQFRRKNQAAKLASLMETLLSTNAP